MRCVYATINAAGVVIGVSELSGLVDDSHMIPLSAYDESLLGKIYDASTGKFQDALPLPQPTVEERRRQVSAAIDLQAKGLRDGVVVLISPAEMSSWPIKQTEARAFVASNDEVDAPMLVAEAGYRKCTTAELVGMVLAKAQQLAGLEAMISGECGRRQDLLRMTGDAAAIEQMAASVPYGWPGFPDPSTP